MIKHRWRELAKSFGNHVDPEKTEQLKRTKSEIENNVTRIFKLIKNEDQGKKEENRKDLMKESELVGLIENFYQQYQSLYALYDHLVGESGRIVRSRKVRKGFSMSPSSSDSEYYSSEDVEGNNARLENEHQKLADSFKHEVKTENSEVADVKQKSALGSEEKEAINSEYMAALSKIKQAESVDNDPNNEVDERVRELSALVEAHEAHGNQSSARVKELEGQLSGFKIELESLCSQKRDLGAWKDDKAAEAKQLGEKNIGLHSRVLQLEIALKEKEDEISDLHTKLKENEESSTSKISDLVTQASNLQLEVDSLRAQKGELVQKMASEKNESLAQVKGLREKEDEISNLQKKLKGNEDRSTSKISDLMTQVSNLQLEVDSLRAQKGELEQKMASEKNESLAQVKGLRDQVNGMQKELKSLRQQKTESEVQLDKKNKEISKHLLKIENLKEELKRKDTVELKMMEERQCLLERLKDSETQLDSRRSQKKNLDKQIKSRNHETNKLRQENEGLLSRIFELERTMNERGDEVYALRRGCEDGRNEICEASTHLVALTAQVSDLKQELDSLQTRKSQSDLQIEIESKRYLGRLNEMENQNNKLMGKIARLERENKKYMERLNEVENQNNNLTVKISDQQRILKEQEDTIKKFNGDHKQAKIWFPSSKLNLQVAERKMEELAEKYRINLEDNVRILTRRVRVAEQIHSENKESYMKIKGTYEEEIRGLKEKVATYQDPVRKMNEISETAKSTLKGLDLVVLKFEEGHKNSLNQITKMSNELESAKTWVTGTASEIKGLKQNVDSLVIQLNEKEEQEGVLREKVFKLEASASKEAGEKSNLVKVLSQLEEQVGNLESKIKDKDEDLLTLGEEKREAIRQLCVLIDHHRSRYDDLKEEVSKRSAAARGRTVT